MLRPPLFLTLLFALGCSKPEVPATPDDALRGALAHFDAGEIDEGVRRTVTAFDLVGTTNAQPGEPEILQRLLTHLLPLEPDVLPPRAMVNTTLAIAALSDVDTARAPLERWVEAHPDAFSPQYSLGVLGRAFGFLDAGRHWFERAAKLAPDRIEPHFELGTMLAGAGDLEGALERFDRALRIAPGDARGRYFRGRVLNELGRADEALDAWRAIYRGEGEHASRAGNDIGTALLARGDREGALEAFLAATAAAPDRASPRLNAGSLLYEIGRGSEAFVHLARARDLRLEDPRPSAILGRIHEDEQRDEDAERAYREAIRRDPTYELASYRLSLLLRRTGRAAEADALAAGQNP